MGFEDLFQILIALAVLFGLFGVKKKRPGGGEAERSRMRPPARPRARPPVPPASAQPRRPLEARREGPGDLRPRGAEPPVEIEVSGVPTTAEELYRILSGEMERHREETLEAEGASLEVDRIQAIERTPVEDIRPFEKVTDVEAYSLETLEPAGEASHEAFHRTYDSPSPAKSPAVRAPRRRRLTLDVRSARQAMLWTEILGPPKGMP